MATTLDELKRYILRKLGAPVINIELADTQMEDRIQEALDEFIEHHTDGTEEAVYLLSVTDGTTVYTLPSQIVNVTKIFSDNQFLQDDEANPIYGSLYAYTGYYTESSDSTTGNGYYSQVEVSDMSFMRTQMALADHQFLKERKFDFNTTTKRFALYEAPTEDTTYALKIYQTETDVTKLYDNKWLRRYATALCGIQWGINLTKFTGSPLPGGANLNGEGIEARYLAEKEFLEEELNRYREPPEFFVG
jgi:hypothetical protein